MEKVIIEGKEYWEKQIWTSDNNIEFEIKIIRKSEVN